MTNFIQEIRMANTEKGNQPAKAYMNIEALAKAGFVLRIGHFEEFVIAVCSSGEIELLFTKSGPNLKLLIQEACEELLND